MASLFVFGLGYTGARLASIVAERWHVSGTGRAGLSFDDDDAVRAQLAWATHVVSSVPPVDERDPVLDRYGDALGAPWLGYLSSTGVYGDTGGAWVDESAPLDGRRGGRIAADLAWQARGARVFRLPGIYGPGRSALDRLAAGQGHRVALPDQVFSRVHVDDIVRGVIAAFDAPPGVYNLADDHPASQDAVVDYAAELLGLSPPPIVALDSLSPAARAFYAENRRVASGKARRTLHWSPRHADYRAGLRALAAAPVTPPAPHAPSGASRRAGRE